MSENKWGVKADYSYTETAIETYCLICGESMPVSSIQYVPKVCDKCKKAVMKVREEMESREVQE